MQRSTIPTTTTKRKSVAFVTKNEWPDPILTLKHIVGFSNPFPKALMWLPGSSCCIYSSFSTIIIRDFQADRKSSSSPFSNNNVDTDNQSTAATNGGGSSVGSSSSSATEYFLRSHTASICGLALSSDGSLLASVEEGSPSIRVWNVQRRACVTVLKGQARGVHALCFSLQDEQTAMMRLCAVGRDESCRMQIFVWDCSVLRGGKGTTATTTSGNDVTIPIVAKQTCDFPVTTIAFSPYELDHLVSCGKENVRFWRLHNSHLSGSPVILNEYSRGTVFTDVGFDPVYQAFPSNIPRIRPLYVSSSLGTLLLINYDTRDVVCVYQLHDAAINCLSINEGFCVTGSEDRFLRVWPLDFTDFFLEAQHEAGVASVQVSLDSLRVLVGSRNGAIGVLDISDQRYDTILRSHTDAITTMALTPISLLSCGDDEVVKKDEIVTTSRDGTLRIWDVVSGQQSYEFDIQKDQVACLVVSPVESGIIAVGFVSGCTRIFDMRNGSSMTSVLREFQQHQSAIRCIQYSRDGEYLYTSASGQQLCMYDARQREYTAVKMLIVDLFTDSGQFCLSSDKKYMAMISADQISVVVLYSRTLLPCSTVAPSHKEQLKELLIARDASELLVLSKSDRLYVFSLPAMQCTQTIPLLGQQSISSITLSPNLKYMATGGADGSLCVWRWDAKQRFSRKQQLFLGQSGEVSRVCFTEDGGFLVASGSSSTLFVWEFHGEAGLPAAFPAALGSDQLGSKKDIDQEDNNSGRIGIASTAGHGESKDVFEFASHSGVDGYDLEEMSPSSHIPVPSSKPRFSLRLAMDALVLKQDATVQEMEDSDVEISTFQVSSTERGSLRMSNVVLGVNPRLVAWSYTTGSLVFALGGALVVDDLESGQQTFHYDNRKVEGRSEGDDGSIKAEIVLMRLSSSKRFVATVSSRLDSVSVSAVAPLKKSSNGDGDDHEVNDSTTRVIPLPIGITSILAMDFVYEGDGEHEGMLFISCERTTDSTTSSAVVVLADASTCSIMWSKEVSTSDSFKIRAIIPIGYKKFVTFTGDTCQLEVHELNVDTAIHSGKNTICSSTRPLTARKLLDAFPSPIQIVRASPVESLGRRRYLLCVDDTAFCFVYDLVRESLVATSQLMLHANEEQQKRAKKIVIDFLEWISISGDKHTQCLVRGSMVSRTLYIHQFPVKSSRGSAQVNWQLVARGGLPLLYHIVLDSSPRSLSVDPLRGLGIVATQDGAVTLLMFKDGSPKRVVKKANSVSSEDSASDNSLQCVSWALEDSVLLTLSKDDSTICCWVPELSREVAQFTVRGAKCTFMAANNAFLPVNGSSSCSGSILLAGYDDGALRVFDLSAMKLIAQSQLPLKQSRYTARKPGSSEKDKSLRTLRRRLPAAASGSATETTNGSSASSSIEQLRFVGTCAAVVVLADYRVLLVDLSELLLQSMSQDPAANSSLKKLKPSFSNNNVYREREIIYRELLLSTSPRRERKPAGGGTIERVMDVDTKSQVEKSFFTGAHGFVASPLTVFPFLLTTVDDHTGATLVKVFGWSGMMTSNEVELSPTDEWRLGSDDGSGALARFVATEKPLVIYAVSDQRHSDNNSPTSPGPLWCFEVRDYLQQSVLRRIRLTSWTGITSLPSFMMRVRADLSSQSNQSGESSLMLVADATGATILALDLEQSAAIPIDSEAAKALSLRFSSCVSAFGSDNRFTLALGSEPSEMSSSTSRRPGVQSERLVIANLRFESI